MNDHQAELTRARLVRENLANRVGQLTAENIALQLRIHELEHPDEWTPVDAQPEPEARSPKP